MDVVFFVLFEPFVASSWLSQDLSRKEHGAASSRNRREKDSDCATVEKSPHRKVDLTFSVPFVILVASFFWFA
jgi:hypothetical protein